MRISVLSFFFVIVFSPLFLTSSVSAQSDNLPKYANERFYPNDVTEKQRQEGNYMYQACMNLGGLGLFNCEILRSQDVIAPEELGVTEEKINEARQTLGFSIEDQEKELARLEKDLDTATTSAQVLGIFEGLTNLVNSILGSEGGEQNALKFYQPEGKTICSPGGILSDCPKKVSIALRPASTQGNPSDTISVDTDGDGIPDNVDSNPTDPDISSPITNPTYTPQPAPTGNSGYDLVQGFKAACRYQGTPGRVHETNVDCLNNVIPRLSFGVVPELRNSAIAYTNLQCVGFVRGMNMQFKGKALDNGGNAIDYATSIPTGYRLISKVSLAPISPKVGDLLLWNIGTFGHIAYIVNVHDSNYVDVIEANWGVDGMVGFRTVNVRAGDILGWLTQ